MISKYEIGENTHILGEICMGSPIPRVIDVEVMMKTFPSMKIIHLVRNPIDSFNSFAKRYEMDSDPVKIGGSWLTLNYSLRSYFENNSEHKGNYMCVKYEDLLDKPKEKIKEVCGFLNLDFEESLTSNLDQRWGRNTQNNISEGTRKIIEEIAKPELTKYNY
jgi:hypothetical protein